MDERLGIKSELKGEGWKIYQSLSCSDSKYNFSFIFMHGKLIHSKRLQLKTVT